MCAIPAAIRILTNNTETVQRVGVSRLRVQYSSLAYRTIIDQFSLLAVLMQQYSVVITIIQRQNKTLNNFYTIISLFIVVSSQQNSNSVHFEWFQLSSRSNDSVRVFLPAGVFTDATRREESFIGVFVSQSVCLSEQFSLLLRALDDCNSICRTVSRAYSARRTEDEARQGGGPARPGPERVKRATSRRRRVPTTDRGDTAGSRDLTRDRK